MKGYAGFFSLNQLPELILMDTTAPKELCWGSPSMVLSYSTVGVPDMEGYEPREHLYMYYLLSCEGTNLEIIYIY